MWFLLCCNLYNTHTLINFILFQLQLHQLTLFKIIFLYFFISCVSNFLFVFLCSSFLVVIRIEIESETVASRTLVNCKSKSIHFIFLKEEIGFPFPMRIN